MAVMRAVCDEKQKLLEQSRVSSLSIRAYTIFASSTWQTNTIYFVAGSLGLGGESSSSSRRKLTAVGAAVSKAISAGVPLLCEIKIDDPHLFLYVFVFCI